ncbi:MAG: MFS transporter [Deltaproteobacteria bacterium]|nr:MFS transporter [Deltaproteobacteria bacterium]
MVRNASLEGIGVCGAGAVAAECTDAGIYLLNMQMGGMLLGGILWGILGDKRGRLTVLFGSITLYSLANVANGLVGDVPAMGTLHVYAVCRLVAGIGLAGELGAGITLVSELMGPRQRGVGTTIVAAFGVSGGIAAGLIGGAFPPLGFHWTTAYYIGGGMGLALLVLRIGVVESGMFASTLAKASVVRGNFLALFTNRKRFLRYLAVIAVGVPVWYVIGIMFLLSPEIGEALGLSPRPNPARSLFFCYAGCTLGGTLCGIVSQRLQSRKKALGIFLVANCVVMLVYFTLGGKSHTGFYILSAVGGAASGYWAVFVSTAAELFGTNLRATVTTTVPNFVRGAAVPLTIAFTELRDAFGGGSTAIIASAATVGAASMAVAFLGLFALDETFGVDLDYVETDEPATSTSGT